jgi:hypothetical protein
MIGGYAVLAGRIQQELAHLELLVDRIERAVRAAGANPDTRDLLFDSAALNLHDFYAGLERIFTLVASGVDQSTPAGAEWHRELLRQMTVEIPGLRPRVISTELATDIDEYLRFRHVVRHIYAFELDPRKVKQLAMSLRSVFERIQEAIMDFAAYLRDLANQA